MSDNTWMLKRRKTVPRSDPIPIPGADPVGLAASLAATACPHGQQRWRFRQCSDTPHEQPLGRFSLSLDYNTALLYGNAAFQRVAAQGPVHTFDPTPTSFDCGLPSTMEQLDLNDEQTR